ncbi:hypothetical protein MMPV_009513 [Pyropia vietnamensis]
MADAPITRSRSVPSDASRPISGPASRGGGSRRGQAGASGIPTRSPILPADGQDVGPVAVSFSDLKATLEDFRSQIIADLAGARSARRPEAQEERGRRPSQGSDTTRTRRRRRRARRSRSSSSSSSTTSESSTSEDSEASDQDPIPAQVAHRGTGSASTALLAPIQCSDDRFAAVLSYETYRLRNKKAKYGSAEARKMGRKTRDMKHSFAGYPPFSGKEPLRIFAWLRKFVKANNDNDVSEGMALYAAPHFMTGDAEVRYTRVLPDSAGTARGAKVDSYPEAINWLLSTYAEPHTLALAQETFSRAAKEPDEPVEAFASRLRALSELCGNIHSEGTMKQQLIQGLPEYVRTDAFVFNTPSATYQQLATYTAGKVKAAQDVARLGQPTSSRGTYQLGKGPRRSDPLSGSRRGVEREDVFVVRRPSVVREDLLPEGWVQEADRPPKSTRVCDASGQLLRTRGVVTLTVYADGTPMVGRFLVVKALSVPLILGMDFQRTHVKAIYPPTDTVIWTHGGETRCWRSWRGSPAPVVKSPWSRGRYDPAHLCLVRGVTVQPRSIQAVLARSGITGRCLVLERPEAVAELGLRLHNAIMDLDEASVTRVYLATITPRPVNVPKGFTIGHVELHNGPAVAVPAEAG